MCVRIRTRTGVVENLVRRGAKRTNQELIETLHRLIAILKWRISAKQTLRVQTSQTQTFDITSEPRCGARLIGKFSI